MILMWMETTIQALKLLWRAPIYIWIISCLKLTYKLGPHQPCSCWSRFSVNFKTIMVSLYNELEWDFYIIKRCLNIVSSTINGIQFWVFLHKVMISFLKLRRGNCYKSFKRVQVFLDQNPLVSSWFSPPNQQV